MTPISLATSGIESVRWIGNRYVLQSTPPLAIRSDGSAESAPRRIEGRVACNELDCLETWTTQKAAGGKTLRAQRFDGETLEPRGDAFILFDEGNEDVLSFDSTARDTGWPHVVVWSTPGQLKSMNVPLRDDTPSDGVSRKVADIGQVSALYFGSMSAVVYWTSGGAHGIDVGSGREFDLSPPPNARTGNPTSFDGADLLFYGLSFESLPRIDIAGWRRGGRKLSLLDPTAFLIASDASDFQVTRNRLGTSLAVWSAADRPARAKRAHARFIGTAAEPSDAGSSDADSIDAGSAGTGGAAASGGSAGTRERRRPLHNEEDGCACRMAPHQRSGAALLLAGAVVSVGFRRRRARARHVELGANMSKA